jgi:hypothetical protein
MGKTAPGLIIVLLLATIAAAQNAPTSNSEPKLPLVDSDTCLSYRRLPSGWKVKRGSPVYSSWRRVRTQLGSVKAGEEVTVLGGVYIIREPDRIVVTQPIPDLDLKPGDIVLRYAYFGEGEATIWAKGVWHQRYDLSKTSEKDGRFGCPASQGACTSKVIEDGIRETWVQVTTATKVTGWLLDSESTHGAIKYNGPLGQLCAG